MDSTQDPMRVLIKLLLLCSAVAEMCGLELRFELVPLRRAA